MAHIVVVTAFVAALASIFLLWKRGLMAGAAAVLAPAPHIPGFVVVALGRVNGGFHRTESRSRSVM